MKQTFLLFSLLVLTAFKIEWTKFRIDNNKSKDMQSNPTSNTTAKKIRKEKKKKTSQAKIEARDQIIVPVIQNDQPTPSEHLPENQVKISNESSKQHEVEILDI